MLKHSITFKNGWNPLYYGVANENLEVIKYLVEEEKLDPVCLSEGKVKMTTPLHQAAYYGKIGAIQLLLKYGANPHCKDEDGFKMTDLLNIRGFSNLIPLVDQMILAQGNDFQACYNLAKWYFSGKNEILKKDISNAVYYIQRGFSYPELSLENTEKLKSLQDKINDEINKINQEKALENTFVSSIQNVNKDKYNNKFSLSSLSFTDFFESVKNAFRKEPISAMEDEKHRLIKKMQ